MIQNLNPAANMFLADVSQVQNEINQLTNEVSSGLKISQPSDDPGDLVTLMQTRTALDVNSQTSNNLAQVLGNTQVAEQALQTASQLMSQALSLGTEGASTTVTASQRTAIAQQVSGILEQLVGLANTQSGTQYIFSGDQPQSASYALDPASPTGVDALLANPAATQQIADPTGVTFSVSLTAQQIFDDRNPDQTPAADNVFAAVNSLLVSLQANDQTGITNAINSLQTASDYLNTQLAFYGSVQDRIQNSQTFASQQNVQLQTQLGQIQDADIAQVAVQLTQDQTQLQAALTAQSQLPRTSLFNFLA
ncbi:MAG TPA: flagellin [Bryobacteraceae bacterium]|nr:flagellin [Bryobacteraceae bacterium]